MKILLAYFSHSGQNYFGGSYKVIKEGNTKRAFDLIKELLPSATTFEIETIKTYPEGYKECCDEALAEQKSGELPKLKQMIDTSSFDAIILGYPCWWGTMPRAVFTFLSEASTAGKLILPICTHEGSGMGSSEGDIASLCKSAKVLKGLAIRGSSVDSSKPQIESWLKANKII